MINHEQVPEEYEEEFSDVQDSDCWTDEDQMRLDGVTPKGSVVPINPDILDTIGTFGVTWETCKVCGCPRWVRYNGHWCCSKCYVEYKTNIQF